MDAGADDDLVAEVEEAVVADLKAVDPHVAADAGAVPTQVPDPNRGRAEYHASDDVDEVAHDGVASPVPLLGREVG